MSLLLSVIMVSVTMLIVIVLSVVKFNAIMPSGVMLSVVMLNAQCSMPIYQVAYAEWCNAPSGIMLSFDISVPLF
jgi:hypothetical protein